VKFWPRKRFIFIDETGVNTAMARRYGRSPPGKRIKEKLPRNTPKPLAIIGALGLEGFKATLEMEGAVTKEVFLLYLQKCLGPKLRRGDFVFLDHLSAHRGHEIRKSLEEHGAKLVWLPRYSPDFNPVEQCWSKMKNALRAAAARTRTTLRRAVQRALTTITPEDAKGWFAHAGYGPSSMRTRKRTPL